MSKRDIIDRIQRLNPTAETGFLAKFSEEDLLAYLHQLQEVEAPRRTAPEPEPAAVG